ncbi:MAG: hypothetical protein ACFB00_01510 [Parvularculaceae bacterium]
MEGLLMGGLALLGLGAALGVVFGWVSFFMLLSARAEVRRLRADVDRLAGRGPASEPGEAAASPAAPSNTAPSNTAPSTTAPGAAAPGAAAPPASPAR